ncbi:hypothetical protein OROHE_014617 [Orobanche hederae]
MEDKWVHIRFHHKGKFMKSGFVGGQETTVTDVELDRFSYSVLMEHVKEDLKYTEIGGVYYPIKGNMTKNGDWVDLYVDNVVDKRIGPFKQMQPHVIIRPRHATKQKKRTFVTTYQLQQQLKNNKKPTDEVFTPRKSARLNSPQVLNKANVNQKSTQVNGARKSIEVTSSRKPTQINNSEDVCDANVNRKIASVKRKLDLYNPPLEDETMDENDMQEEELMPQSPLVHLPPPPPGVHVPPPPLITDYERERAINVFENDEMYKALGLPTLGDELRNKLLKKVKGKENRQDDDADDDGEYFPEGEEHSEDDASKIPKKKTKKANTAKPPCGPTTRSRANVASTTDENAIEKDTTGKEGGNLTEPTTPACNIQLPVNEGKGTMAAYLAMRLRQQKNAQNASASGTVSKKAVMENDLQILLMKKTQLKFLKD